MSWVYLGIAIISEVAATLSLRASEGFTKLVPAIVVVVGYVVAFAMLGLALKGINVGTAYAIWSGLGTAGAVVGGWRLFGEQLNALAVTGIAIIIAGVILLTYAAPSHG